MYEHFGEHGFGLSANEYAELVKILGREASSYEEFVRELVESKTSVMTTT